jgi:cell division protease FtsH
MGKERRSLILSDEEKRITAYHEAGHALTAKLLPGSDPVHKVSIIPRGRALGVTMQLPEEDRHGYSRNYLRNNLVILLGGRVAEEIIFTDITTGAGNDIERVTKTARKMVCEWGMSEKIGPQTVGENQQEVFLGREWGHTSGNVSADMARLVDSEIKALVDEARERCRTMLTENIDALHAIAEALLERETISGEDIDILMRGEKLPPFQSSVQPEAPKSAENAPEEEFQLEAVEPEEAPVQPEAEADTAKEEKTADEPRPEAPAEPAAEPKKPANRSFSGHWDSFSSPSDKEEK